MPDYCTRLPTCSRPKQALDAHLAFSPHLVGDDFPVAQWQEHREEVSSVDWNLVEKMTFLSSSWDGSIKVRDPAALNVA